MASLFDAHQQEIFRQLNEVGSSYRTVIHWLSKKGIDASHQSLWAWHQRKVRKIHQRNQHPLQMPSIQNQESLITTFSLRKKTPKSDLLPMGKVAPTVPNVRGIALRIEEEQRLLDDLGPLGHHRFPAKKK